MVQNERAISKRDRVVVFDTTLRDGEQSPGASLDAEQKLKVASMLARLGVDVMEVGFPAASPDDFEGVKRIAESVGCGNGSNSTVICALARATERDIGLAWEAIRGARNPRIHTFLATSPIHREFKLQLSREAVLEQIQKSVTLARSLCCDVEFSAEDAMRTEEDFLIRALQTASEAGATTLNVPDTVGFALPEEFGDRIARIRRALPKNVVLSVHCHNDLGLATANTLAGLRHGARQVEVTVNGIGERAGNCSLEELVMALKTHESTLHMHTGIVANRLTAASRAVSVATGISVQPNKAIVGSNAFAHEAGIHQDGMLKHQETYEIMRPESVGATASQLVLGKHSGRHALKLQLEELGFDLDAAELNRAFASFKSIADKKKHVTDADLCALVRSDSTVEERFKIEELQVVCGSPGMSTASVRISTPDRGLRTETSRGSGPVDAAFKAVDLVMNFEVELLEYKVQSITKGIDALGEVSVRVRREGLTRPIARSYAADTDIVVASARAYLGAINQLLQRSPENPALDSPAQDQPVTKELAR